MATPFKYLQPVETQFVPRYASPNTQLLASSAQAVEKQYQTAKQNYDKLDLAFDNVREQVAGMPKEAQQFVEGYIQNSKEELDSLVESGGYRGSMAAITSMAKKFNKDITPIVQDSEKFKLGIQAINESNADAFGKTVLTNLAQTRLSYNPETKRLTGVDTQEFTNIANNWVNLSDYFQDYLSSMEETTFGRNGQTALKGLSPDRAITGLLQKIEADENISRQLALETEYYVENQPSFFPEEVQSIIQEHGDEALNKTFQIKGYDRSMSLMEYVAFKKANPGFTAEVTSEYVEDRVTTTGQSLTGGFTKIGLASLEGRATLSLEDDAALYYQYDNAKDYLNGRLDRITQIDKDLVKTNDIILDLVEQINPELANKEAVKKDSNTGFLSINTDVISEEEAFGRNRELLGYINAYNDLIADKRQINSGFEYLSGFGEDAIKSFEFLQTAYTSAFNNERDPYAIYTSGYYQQPLISDVPEELVFDLTDSSNISVTDGKVKIDEAILDPFINEENEIILKALLDRYQKELQIKFDKSITEEIQRLNEQDIRYETDTFLIHKNTTDPVYNDLVARYANQSISLLVDAAIKTSAEGSRVIIGNQDVDVDSTAYGSKLLLKNGVTNSSAIQPAESFRFAYDEQGKGFLIFTAASEGKSIEVHLFGQEANDIIQAYINSNQEITFQARNRLFGAFDKRLNNEQEVDFDEAYLRTTFGITNISNLNIKRGKLRRSGKPSYTATFDIKKPDGSIETKEISADIDGIYDQFLQLASQ